MSTTLTMLPASDAGNLKVPGAIVAPALSLVALASHISGTLITEFYTGAIGDFSATDFNAADFKTT